MNKKVGIVVLSILIFIMSALLSHAATYTVCPAGPPACDFAAIQSAISNASTVNGDIISVAAGTYAETLDINKEVTIIGDDRSTVIIDSSGSADYAVDVTSNNVVLSTFTLIGSSNYGIKPLGVAGITIQDITVQNSGSTGIDLNGVSSSSINNVEVSNTLNGGGIALTDCNNIAVQDITTSGNAWGGIAINTYGQWYPGGSDSVIFSGTIDVSDTCVISGVTVECGFYTMVGNFANPLLPYPITNLVPPSQFNYILRFPTAPIPLNNLDLYLEDFETASEYGFLVWNSQGIRGRIIDLSTGSDAVPYNVSIVINNGSVWTNISLLSLDLTAFHTNQMRFSCNSATWTAWELFNPTRLLELASTPGCSTTTGLKTIFFEARNFFSQLASGVIAFDDIIYVTDATPAGTGAGIGTNVTINDIIGSTCIPPIIYKDHTARIWEPNDQTIYTAEEYGAQITNKHGYSGYEVPTRQDYAFAGEILKYFIIVEDLNGADDIADLRMVLGFNSIAPPGKEVGQCARVTDFTDVSAFISDLGGTITAYDPEIMASFVCTLIVQSGWTDLTDITFRARDGESLVCAGSPNVINSTQSDWINFNPELGIAINGPIQFGEVSPDSTSMSTTVYVQNAAEDSSGVVMDMYIASSDYFTDPVNPTAICGRGNGIRYDNFEYYATKGSINSGANDNLYPGLGEIANGLCIAGADEFTPLPSHSGHIEDMCRIINHEQDGSLLAEGAEMSLTFKLEVPTPCDGFFTDGQFWIVGRVV